MNTYEIIVAGGGPIGCFTAHQLASKGIQVGIIEEHSNIGEPLHCTGLVTKRVFDITHCSKAGIIQNKIYGAHIHSPDGTTLTIGGEKIQALVIDRQRFDKKLAQTSQRAGVDLLTENKIISAKKKNHTVILSIKKKEQLKKINCQLLIGADGANSKIRSIFRFPKPTEILKGINAELHDAILDPRFVHIFVGENIAPGFFAWIIPTNIHGTTARIGLGIKSHSLYSIQHYFTKLLQQSLLQGTTIMKRFGGLLPLGPLKKTVVDNVMLVGDAAAQVKPTSGGGLYPGLLCGKHCVFFAEKAFKQQKFGAQFLKQYHMKWIKDIGRELSKGMIFRKIFTNLTDDQFNKFLKKLNNSKILDIINNFGDIDYPSRLAVPLLKTSPSLLTLAPIFFKRTKK